MSRNAVWMRALGAAVVAFALALAAFTLPAQASAAPADPASEGSELTGVLDIGQTEATRGVTYRAWRVIAAEVSDAEGAAAGEGMRVAENPAWPSDAMRAAVEDGIHGIDAAYAGATAQDAAAWMAAHVDDDRLAVALAEAVADADIAPDRNLGADEPTELAQGYWLVLADDASVGPGMAGTAPIFVAVGGSPQTAQPKAAAPTIAKHVWEDSDSTWRHGADATVGDSLSWRVEVTVPAGLRGFDAYAVQVTDTMDAGIDPSHVLDSLSVWVRPGAGGNWDDAVALADGWRPLDAGAYDASLAGQQLTVAVADLVAVVGADGFGRGAQLCLAYDAPLASQAATGNAGNVNSAVLAYPASPLGGSAETPCATAVAYTWDPFIVKRSSADEDTVLSGAELQIKDDRGRYWDGEAWVAEAVTAATDDAGEVRFYGTDSGIFEVREVAPPDGYRAFDGSRAIVVSATGLDTAGETSSGIELSVSAEDPLRADGADAGEGAIELSLLDDPAPENPGPAGSLPLTGATIGVMVFVAAGAAAIAILVANRKRKARDER